MLENIKNAVKRYNKQRQTVAELNRLTDRELNDIGLNRSDIHEVAKRHPFI